MKRFTQVTRCLEHHAVYGPRGGLTVTWVVEAQDGQQYTRTKKGKNALAPPVRVEAGKGIYHAPPQEEKEPMSTTNSNKVSAAAEHLRETTDNLDAILEYTVKELCGQVQEDLMTAAEQVIARRKLASGIVSMDDNDDALETALLKLTAKREELQSKLADPSCTGVRRNLWEKRLASLDEQEEKLCQMAGLLPEPSPNGKPKRNEKGQFISHKTEATTA